MMAPFDGSGPASQQQGMGPGAIQRRPMGPGQQGGQPGMHQQPMNAPYMHRQPSAGIGPQGPGYMPSQSPGSRQNSFSMPNSQGHYSSSHPPLHSSAHQQQPQQQQQQPQQGFNPHQQMHHGNMNQGPIPQNHMGMPSMPQQHGMRQTSSQRGGMGMNNGMGNSMDAPIRGSMGGSMNNSMNMNSMGNPMGGSVQNTSMHNNSMHNGMGSMNSGMNNQMGMMGGASANGFAGPMGSSMNSTTNGSMNGMNNGMGTSMNSSMGNNAMGGPVSNSGMNSNSINANLMSGNNAMGGNPMGNNSMSGNSMNSTNVAGSASVNAGNSMMNNGNNNNPTSSSSGSNGNMNGGWQSDSDTPHRREMIQRIVEMFRRERNGSQAWLEKLPTMARQLEVSLYRGAPSFEAYTDLSTLRQRLNHIAEEVSAKVGVYGASDNRSSFSNGSSGASVSGNNGSANMRPDMNSGAGSPALGMSSNSQQNQIPSNHGGLPASMNQMSSMPPSSSSSVTTNNVNSGGSGLQGMGNNSMGSHNYQSSRQQSASSSSGRNNSSSGQGSSGSGPNRNDSEWRIRIRHKQQRLLLLHHSARCPREDGRCTVTPLCKEMKQLWRHMEGCRDNNCTVPHCFSSRAILSHYRRCRDASCPACGPVRETVQNGRPRQRSGINQSSGSSQQRSMSGGGSNGLGQSTSLMQNTFGGPPGNFGGSNVGASSGNDNGSSMSINQGQGMSFPSANQPSQPQYNNRSTSSSSNASGGGGGNNPMSASSVSRNSASTAIQQPSNRSNIVSSNPTSGGPTDVAPADRIAGSASSNHRSVRNSTSGAGGGSSRGTGSDSQRNDSEWQRIRHKQQRLLLLRHASRCQYPPDNCPVTPHCASMKRLWDHIASCKDQNCSVPHCMSSRYVLSHYRRCKDTKCPACGPVRDTIRRSNELEQGQGNNSSNNNSGSSTTNNNNNKNNSHSGNNPVRSGSISASNNQSSSRSHDPLQATTAQARQQPSMQQSSTISGNADPTSSMLSGASGSNSPEIKQQNKRMKTDHTASSHSATPLQQDSMVCAPVSAQSVPDSTSSQEVPFSRQQVDGQTSKQASVPSPAPAPVKETGDRSLLNSFTAEQLTVHLASLNRAKQLPPSKLKTVCSEVLKGLQTHPNGWVFNTPVDPDELGLPDYFDIIKKPMDLGTIGKRLDSGHYHEVEDFKNDVELTFDNALTYNENGSVVYNMADELKKKFETDFQKMMEQLDREDKERRKSDRACSLCGCEKLLFEPPVFFCNGMNCASKRIRRNSHFYIGGNNQYFWCNQCYNELDGNIPIELVDLTIKKSDLKKKKNDEQPEESWVKCDSCKRWIHQICGLFNVRLNKEPHSEYCCPMCLLERRKKKPSTSPTRPPMAADLPRTRLSEALESHVSRRIQERKRELVEEKVKTENASMEEALKTYENSGQIIIRQVTSMDRKLEVRELMKKRYAHKKYPDEFPFRCKCIVVFQHIDGVDVVLFALYVYEHGEDNPAPNSRCVYISYLDSVHFMRPRRLRTFVYHEILIAYLDYVRQRGFATAHIWACPPLKGDDYIFYAKPEDQKTPRDNRLRQWYIDMLLECQKRGIVGKVTNMYDLYFANEALDATAVPYLEGDYFPGEAENIIKMLEEGGGKKKSSSSKSKKKNQSKAKNRGGTRSTGMDEEALLASGMMGGMKNLSELDRDQVMVKLGETIQPMKESFIVAFLNWSGAKKEDLEVPEAIQKYRDEHPEKLVPLKSGSKRDADGKTADEKPPLDRYGRPVKVIDDDAEDLDCEFLNNRQAFLNLCRGNHYQFDELRRAKHTSMMVLWHLHNRDAPKFVQQCVACNREILSGKRYHCSVCPDFDLCAQCYNDPKTNRGVCNHTLQPIEVEADSGQDGASSSSGMTAAQRKARQRTVTLHIQLIEHAAKCDSTNCTSKNCVKMKSYLEHVKSCPESVQGGCRICKRIWTLLRIHAQKCKEPVCPIPQCMTIREKMRQLQKQQQAMDDRRRLEMNRHYRKGGISVA